MTTSNSPKPPIPLGHDIMGPLSEVTNQLVAAGAKWKQSHAYRYRAFSRTDPYYEKCAYAIKTRHLHWTMECQDWAHELVQLRDNLTQVLDSLNAQGLIKQDNDQHDQ